MGLHLIAETWLQWFAEPGTWLAIAEVAGGLGFVIFVHELGHFLVAKACGVKCEKFYLGFDLYGLKLFKFKAGETEYGIGILPLGGYVKMLGQDDNPAAAAREAERSRLPAGAAATEPPHDMPHGDLPPEP
ncbi:MAG TPA: site-2 protease family protein, partial [Pirellulales bacterium]|nr:site-2 protease family protein [Pirellulales bacterium]